MVFLFKGNDKLLKNTKRAEIFRYFIGNGEINRIKTDTIGLFKTVYIFKNIKWVLNNSSVMLDNT